jgi:hypothetical protein
MPIHDWTRVEAGIFHAFHHDWITEIARALNGGVLPDAYYALPEQQAAGFGPDVLTLQSEPGSAGEASPTGTATALQARPRAQFTAETDSEFYRRKKSSIAIRHVSGDRIVAMLEIISPGNKSSAHGLRSLVEKACELLEHRIHLLVVDPLPPGPRWQEVDDTAFMLPQGKPLVIASYECGEKTRAYIEPVAVGEALPAMPLFLEPARHILVPLEPTYQAAFAAMPRRWKAVLESTPVLG